MRQGETKVSTTMFLPLLVIIMIMIGGRDLLEVSQTGADRDRQ